MIRHLLIFVITAALGALAALVVRSAWHQPYATAIDGHEQHAPVTPAPQQAPAKPTNDPHAGHASTSLGNPVNDTCAICGMDANPKLTGTYREKVIAFGCATCPAKFAKDPERFGPYFLRNQEAP